MRDLPKRNDISDVEKQIAEHSSYVFKIGFASGVLASITIFFLCYVFLWS